jgi:hypothetical protein
MKWYDVKKYAPAIAHCMYMVRLTNADVCIAKLEGKEDFTWVTFDDKYFDDYPVTHFCVIEPIQLED